MSVPAPFSNSSRSAFTLIEILVVMAIFVVLVGLSVLAVSGLKRAGELSRAVSGITGVVEQARAHAMANNTYVYVGFMEVDADVPELTTPQAPATGSVGGRVILTAVVSKDGTVGCPDANAPTALTASNLSALFEPVIFTGLHLADFGDSPPASGKMMRPEVSQARFRLGNSQAVAATTYHWPVASPSPQYSFSKVLQINPQGGICLPQAGGAVLTPWMEIALQETRGNIVPSVPGDQNIGNHAVIQINGLSGMTRIYRPGL